MGATERNVDLNDLCAGRNTCGDADADTAVFRLVSFRLRVIVIGEEGSARHTSSSSYVVIRDTRNIVQCCDDRLHDCRAESPRDKGHASPDRGWSTETAKSECTLRGYTDCDASDPGEAVQEPFDGYTASAGGPL